jgi:hypothetical protein
LNGTVWEQHECIKNLRNPEKWHVRCPNPHMKKRERYSTDLQTVIEEALGNDQLT